MGFVCTQLWLHSSAEFNVLFIRRLPKRPMPLLFSTFFLHRCPPGHMTRESPSGKVCIYTLCASRPCRHGTCVAHSPSRYSCLCSDGYRGRHCEVALAVFHDDDSLSLSSMFAISICVMAFLGSYVDYVLFYMWWPDVLSPPVSSHLFCISSRCLWVFYSPFMTCNISYFITSTAVFAGWNLLTEAYFAAVLIFWVVPSGDASMGSRWKRETNLYSGRGAENWAHCASRWFMEML